MKKKLLLGLSLLLTAILLCVGIVTAVAEEVEPTLSIDKKNLSFSDKVYLLFAVDLQGASPTGDFGMLYWTEPQTSYEKGTEELSVKTAGSQVISGKTYYVFNYEEFAAKNMADEVFARAYVTVDGTTYYSDVTKYSILEYAYTKLGKIGDAPTTNENLKTLLTEMLSYGAAAQKYFGYNTGRLVDANFYQVSVMGGTLANGFTSGLYLPGDSVTVTAGEAPEGYEFSHWTNSAGENISEDAVYEAPIAEGEQIYTANYQEKLIAKGSCGTNLTWKLKLSGELIIEGTGAMTNYSYYSTRAPWYSYRDQIQTVTIANGVTSIGSSAFYECGSMLSIDIPNSVTSIGDSALDYCASLISIEIPANVTSIGSTPFWCCDNLMGITVDTNNTTYHSSGNCLIATNSKTLIAGTGASVIPNDGSVTSIQSYAFYNCTGLSSITVPDCVTSIGSSAFSGCSGLINATIGNGVTSLGSIFEGCTGLTTLTLPFVGDRKDGTGYHNNFGYVFGINEYYMHYNIPASLKTVAITGGTSIPSYAFAGCGNIETILLSNGITSIGKSAFANCNSLTSINLPTGVTRIEEAVFESCGFTSFTVPNHITSIGDWTFVNCESLESITIPNSVTSIGSSAFRGCSSLASIHIPRYVTTGISAWSFDRCTSLRSITVDANNTAYQVIDGVLYSKDGKTLLFCPVNRIESSLTIPEGVTLIEMSAFVECKCLKSITIPVSVTDINAYVFETCSNLKNIYYNGSITQWEAVDKYTDWDNGTGDYNVYCTDGQISKSGDILRFSSGLEYELMSGGYYSVVGIGNCTDKELLIPAMYMGYPVKAIGYEAFRDCSSLTSIILPDSITAIDDLAFFCCDSLTSVTLPDSIMTIGQDVFVGCYSLTYNEYGATYYLGNDINPYLVLVEDDEYAYSWEYEIHPDTKFISNDAFFYNESISYITIPAGVVSIGGGAFNYCTRLSTVYFENGSRLMSIGNGAFGECTELRSINLPDTVTSIGRSAFSDCSMLTYNAYDNAYYLGSASNPYFALIAATNTSITSCNIHTDTKIIAGGAFYCCNGLTEFVIPNGVIVIGDSAFDSCSNLTNISIPNSVTVIEDSAFSYCSSLVDVSIPASVTHIGDSAFYGCRALSNITVANGNANYQSINGNLYTKDGKTLIKYATAKTAVSFVVPYNVTSIGAWAFADCQNLTGIILPSGLTRIELGVFTGCSKLKTITIPDGVTYIDYHAFSYCTALTTVTIPDSILYIASNAFDGCDNLTYREYDNGYYLGNTNNPYLVLMDVNDVASFEINSATKIINSSAFYYCSSLESITIPKSITLIEEDLFYNCYNLTTIYFGGSMGKWNAITEDGWDENISYYYTVYCDESLEYSNYFDYAVVTGMGSCTDTDIYIDEYYFEAGYGNAPVTEIESYAFSWESELTSVTIPKSITYIGANAFYGCNNLKDVYFLGTEDEWNAITGITNIPAGATVHFC